jgi:Tfp pilus assembly protein PilZ
MMTKSRQYTTGLQEGLGSTSDHGVDSGRWSWEFEDNNEPEFTKSGSAIELEGNSNISGEEIPHEIEIEFDEFLVEDEIASEVNADAIATSDFVLPSPTLADTHFDMSGTDDAMLDNTDSDSSMAYKIAASVAREGIFTDTLDDQPEPNDANIVCQGPSQEDVEISGHDSGALAADELWDLEAYASTETCFSFSGGGTPLERVRFVSPLKIWGTEDCAPTSAAMLNLAAGGLACVGPLRFSVGECVYLDFSLELGSESMRVHGEVVWRSGTEEQTILGIRFREVEENVTQAIEKVIRERSEGKTAAWPLPPLQLNPQHTDTANPPNVWLRSRPIVHALSGVAGGWLLAVGLSALMSAGSADTSSSPQTLVAKASKASIKLSDSDKVTSQNFKQGTSKAKTHKRQLLKEVAHSQRKSTPKPSAVPTVVKSSSKVALAQLPKDKRAQHLPKPVTKVSELLRDNGSLPSVSGDRNTLDLELITGEPVEHHVAFWLDKPKRLVIDIPGQKSHFSKRDYPLDHPLASRLRIGTHPNKVRFVIETVDDVATGFKAAKRDGGLAIVLRRQSS